MTLEKPFERLADEIIEELAHQIEASFNEIYEQLGPGQLFIQFIDHRRPGSKDVPLRLPRFWKTTEDFSHGAAFPPESIKERHMGLTRWVPLNDVVTVYPTDQDTSIHYVETDPRVVTELVGPIHYKGKVTGVVLADRIVQGRVYNQEEKALFTSFLHLIDREIRDATFRLERRQSEEDAKGHLNTIAGHCYNASPLTARGYIAVKRWDGLLEYFTFGEGKEMFLDLAPHEGLCGKVLRTGQFENPEQPLLEVGDYIPSDSSINSEIVYPINSNGETIGIINLESYVPEAYDEKVVKLLAKEAADAIPYAEIFTKPPDSQFGYAIADLFKSSLVVRPHSKFEEFKREVRGTLERWAKKMLPVSRCVYWLRREDIQPSLLRGLSWETAAQGTPAYSLSSRDNILFAPLLLQGEPQFIIALELETEPSPQEVKTLRALCRIASEALRRARYEYRVRDFIKLLETLTLQDGSETLINQVVQEMPFILQSNHCSLFYCLRHAESEVFVLGPSTAKEIHAKGQRSGYLPLVSEGLTGFVAATGVPLRILNVRDGKELKNIHPALEWKSLISEEIEVDCRSYLAVPIFNPQEPEKVIGVLRTHRDSKSHRSGFTKEDDGMFKALAYLLGKHLSVFLSKKTAVMKK